MNKVIPRLSGAGSGKGGGRTGVEASDTLRSKMYARVIDLVSEGEIEGFVDDLGNLLENAILSSYPTIVEGVVQNDAVLAYGGKGYTLIDATGAVVKDGTREYLILDPIATYDGTDYGKNAGTDGRMSLTIEQGVVTGFAITNGGKNYSRFTQVDIPYSIGKGIVIDGQALQEHDQRYNFNFVSVSYRTGSQTQSPISGYGQTEQTVAATNSDVAVTQAVGEHFCTLTSDSADILTIGIYFNSLYRQDKNTGDIGGTSVTYQVALAISASDAGGNSHVILAKTPVLVDMVDGKTSSTYAVSKSISVNKYKRGLPEGYHGFIYTVYVSRITPDRDLTYSDKFLFKYVTAVTSQQLSYPNSACIAVQLDAQNFSSIPTRGYRLRLLKVKIPSNYFPLTRQYNRTRFGVTAVDATIVPAAHTTLVDNAVVFNTTVDRTYEVILIDAEGVNVTLNTQVGTGGYVTYVNALITLTADLYIRSYPNGSLIFAAGDAVVDQQGNAVDQEWDGSFYVAWTNNPAWVFYDLATNTRYGAGRYVTGIFGGVDKWALYRIARYCDVMVPSGYDNGLEPRFTSNLYLSGNPEDAYKVLTQLASIFRGMLYWDNGSIVPVQDSYLDPDSAAVLSFTQSNVVDGTFNYAGTSRKARHTAASVTWNDPANYYKQAIEYVEDASGILTYGLRVADVNAIGCTSRGQARRVGKWLIHTELYETETVVFRTGMEAAYLRPFSLIKVFDTVKAGMLFAGRIFSISADRLTLVTDLKSTLDPAYKGSGWTLVVADPKSFMPDSQVASATDSNAVQAPQLTNIPVGSYTGDMDNNLALTLSYPLPDGVVIGGIWGIQSDALSARIYRVLGVQEIDPNVFEVTGSLYNPGKYDAVEKNLLFTVPNYSTLNSNPKAPTNLILTVLPIYTVAGLPAYRIDASWTPDESVPVKEFDVLMRFGEDNFQPLVTTKAHQYDVEVNQAGTYTIRVYAKGMTGSSTSAYIEESTVVGIDQLSNTDISNEKLERISGLELVGQGNDTNFYASDIHLEWRLNSPVNSFDIGSEPNGANSGRMSDDFACYRIRVFDPSILDNPETQQVENLLYESTTTDPRFTLTHSMLKQMSASGIPLRSLAIEITHKNIRNGYSRANIIRISNPLIPAPDIAAITIVQAGAGKPIYITLPTPTDLDFSGYRIWASSSDMSTADTLTVSVVPTQPPVYEGRANPVILTLPAGTNYFKFAFTDTFSQDSLDCVASFQKTATIT